MVQNFKHMLGASALKRMIKHGSKVKEDQAGAVNAEADHASGISVATCQNDKNHKTGNAEAKTNAARNAIGDFLD